MSTLREEWNKIHAEELVKDGILKMDAIADWWIATLKERIEATKKDIPGKLEHLHNLGLAKTARRKHTNQARGFNEALDTITRLLE